MSSEGEGQRWARVAAPAWLWGGRPRQLFENAEFQTRRTSDGEMLIRPREAYTHRQPDLVRLIKVAGPQVKRESWERLSTLCDDDVEADAVEAGARRLGELKDSTSDLHEMVTYYQVAVSSIAQAGLPEQSRIVLSSLRDVTIEGQEHAFPNAGVFGMRRSDALLHRVKLVSVLLRIQHDARLRGGDVSEVQARQRQDGPVFAASSGLQKGFYLLDQYIGPVLGALTPAVWGFAAHRGHGPVIFSFGRQISGTQGNAGEFLRTLPLRGADRVTQFDRLAPTAVSSALSWWTDRLNETFAVITDPSVFVDQAGVYRPSLHLQTILTIEQVFSRVLSLQAAHHDLSARRVLLFTLLDSLESLTGRPIETNCGLTFATKTLEKLRLGMSEEAQQVLLTRAKAGTTALEGLQSGFFLRELDGKILLRPSTGQTVSPERAAAEYMKLLRNATHGHGTVKASAAESTESLLARHDGEVPHEIGLLGWLYLLDLLSRPDALRSHLSAQSRRTS